MLDGLAALFWAGLASGMFRRFVDTGNLLALVLCVHAGLAAWLLVTRRRASQEAPWWQRLLAWGDALLPQAFAPGPAVWWASALGGAGALLSVLALVHLGKSFGIAPADRGLVTGGPYRWIRHPMYAGEVLSLLAVTAAHPVSRNLALFGLSLALIWLRIRWEEGLLSGYEDYARRVRWRLLPGVW